MARSGVAKFAVTLLLTAAFPIVGAQPVPAQQATSTLRVCKTGSAAPNVPISFTANGVPFTLTLPTKPCEILTYPTNTVVTLVENAVSGTQVTSITIAPATAEVAGTRNLATGTIGVRMNAASVQVVFTNGPASQILGTLSVCKAAGAGTTPFPFTVTQGTNTFSLNLLSGGDCWFLTTPVGNTVFVDENPPTGFQVTGIAVSPTSAILAGSLNLGTGTVGVTIGEGTTVVTYTNGTPPPPGTLSICKAAGAGTSPFPFTVTSPGTATQSFNLFSGGDCSSFSYPVGTNVVVDENPPSGFQVNVISVTPASAVVAGTLNLGTGTVGVTIGAGTTSVTYTNGPVAPPVGTLLICKAAGAGELPFPFTTSSGGATQSFSLLSGGSCRNTSYPVGTTVVVDENPPTAFQVNNIAVSPTSAIVTGTLNLGTGTVTVTVGTGTTTVTYTNGPVTPQGLLKVCKVAGPGVAVGTPFNFTAGSTSFQVNALAPPGGECTQVGTFPIGSSVLVDEVVPTGTQVESIVVDPASAMVGGSLDLAAGSVVVTIGAGTTEVIFTNKRTGIIEVCKSNANGVIGNFMFVVAGQLVTVASGKCSPTIEVPAGQLTVTEIQKPGFQTVGCSTFPTTALTTNCNNPAQQAVVTVAPGGSVNQTALTFVNRPTGAAGIQSSLRPLPGSEL